LNGMVFIHLVSFLSTSLMWSTVKDYNGLSLFTVVFCMSAGSLVPMYPMGELETKEKESWLLGGTQVVKWAILTTAVAIPILKVFYFDWVKLYLSPFWVAPAIALASMGYFTATVGLLALRFSLSPHLKARL
ncbi:hypothetical protein H4R21_000668, partial [Coemansia helicoidea]